MLNFMKVFHLSMVTNLNFNLKGQIKYLYFEYFLVDMNVFLFKNVQLRVIII